jgi:predicted amidohydrolase
MLCNLEIPVRLIAIPEGALQGFNDEILDVDHADYAKTCAIHIPGPETEALGALAKEYGAFIMAEAKARHPDWPDPFFNIGFILNPKGAVILPHYKISLLNKTGSDFLSGLRRRTSAGRSERHRLRPGGLGPGEPCGRTCALTVRARPVGSPRSTRTTLRVYSSRTAWRGRAAICRHRGGDRQISGS